MDNRKEKKLFLVGGIVFYLLIILSTFGIQYLSKFNSILLGNMYCFTKISSALVFMSAVCLFMFFKNLKLKESKILNWLGSVSFGVYLFHEHPYMRNFLWFELFDVNLYTNTMFFGFKGICIVCAIFIVGGLYETIRQFLFSFVEKLYLKGKKYLLSNNVD
jgi:peptidoglycan/LPS O-acetylase OafA/YrhL